MNALMRKGWADLKGRFWQSALIALSVAGAAALLYLGLTGLFAASSPYEKQMERANGAHAWFFLRADAASREAAGRIAGGSDVTDSVLQEGAESFLLAPDLEKVPYVNVIAIEPGPPALMGYVLLEGRDLEPGDRNAALLAASMARFLDVGVGDSVRLQTLDGPRSFQIAGLYADPKSCAFPRCGGHALYILPETLASLRFPVDDQLLLLGVKLHEAQTADTFVSRMLKAESGNIRYALSWLFMLDFYKGDRIFNVVPIMLFGLVAVAAAAMILANMIGGTVLGQYREIAVLKCLGFTGGQVLLLYIGQTLLLGLLGGALGILGGHLLGIRAMAPLSRSMGTPDVLHFMPGVALGVMGLVLAVTALFTALPAWRAASLRPAAMLGSGFDAPRGRTPLSVRLLAALRLPAPALLGVKDAMARPGRAAMTVLSLTICLLTITQGMNFPGLAREILANRELIGINWDLTVSPKLATLAEAEEAVRATPAVQGYYREVVRTVTMVDQEFNLNLRAVDGDWHKFGFRLLEGRLPERTGEILIAPRAWERLGVKLGDTLQMQLGGKTLPVTVVGRYQDQLENGRIALTTFDTLDQFQLSPAPLPRLRVKLQPDADWTAARRALMDRSADRLLISLEDRELPDFATDVVAMMRVLGWVMAAIAALSILGASLLTAREQMREVGIRKALGMTPAQVLAAAAAGGAWYGLIALVLALPSAYLLQKGLTVVMAAVVGLGEMELALPGSILALAAGAGLLLAVGAALPAAGWGARVKTAAVLHAE